MPSGLIWRVHTTRNYFPEMYSVAKNASPSFARLQIYTFFPNNLKKSKLKNRAQSFPWDLEEKKFHEMNSAVKNASPSLVKI